LTGKEYHNLYGVLGSVGLLDGPYVLVAQGSHYKIYYNCTKHLQLY